MFFCFIELSWPYIGEVWNARKVLAFDVEVHEVSINFFLLGSILEHIAMWWEPTLSRRVLSWSCMDKVFIVGEVMECGGV